jgi:hypothetical protein
MNNILFLKWSPSIPGQFYEKSKISDKHKIIGNNIMETTLQEGHEFINNNNLKRENQFERMNQREMIAQKNLNPFLTNNYLEDLQNQEDFLTPKNSNMCDTN